jgi:hypothetical protein
VYRSVNLTPLRDPSEDFGITPIGQMIHQPINGYGKLKVTALVCGYTQNHVKESILIQLQFGQLCYQPPFYHPTFVEHPGLDCKFEHTHGNQGVFCSLT